MRTKQKQKKQLKVQNKSGTPTTSHLSNFTTSCSLEHVSADARPRSTVPNYRGNPNLRKHVKERGGFWVSPPQAREFKESPLPSWRDSREDRFRSQEMATNNSATSAYTTSFELTSRFCDSESSSARKQCCGARGRWRMTERNFFGIWTSIFPSF